MLKLMLKMLLLFEIEMVETWKERDGKGATAMRRKTAIDSVEPGVIQKRDILDDDVVVVVDVDVVVVVVVDVVVVIVVVVV